MEKPKPTDLIMLVADNADVEASEISEFYNNPYVPKHLGPKTIDFTSADDNRAILKVISREARSNKCISYINGVSAGLLTLMIVGISSFSTGSLIDRYHLLVASAATGGMAINALIYGRRARHYAQAQRFYTALEDAKKNITTKAREG